MDVLPKNQNRAGRATQALRAYKRDSLRESGPVDESTVTDLIVDINHYCDVNSLDFHQLFEMAMGHYYAEAAGEDDE